MRSTAHSARMATLVTGGSGFLGSHLVERLAADGAAVTVFDSMRAGSAENLAAVADRVRIIQGDVRDLSAVMDALEQCTPEVVYHLAANASVPGSVEDPAYDYEANATGTFVLLDALRRLDMKPRVVLASSGAVYGQPDRFPITEDFPLRPISPYGYSKLCAEHIARMFLDVYGIPTVIARIFNSYGPRAPRYIVYDFLKKLERNPTRLEILGDGKQQRDFTYVTDTVAGLVLLAEKGVPGEAYNVSSGQNHSVTELAEMLVDALGLTSQVQFHFTGSSWAGDAQYWKVDVSKLRALGFEGKIALREGLRLTAFWSRAAGANSV
ncbi:MAG: SDR family NAD(P)-dependent oxidoreductase [Chthonomonadales bacterium]|nr:SDR family NAD(P)-dependent oxidoreductase [Chthonomonadales bacterium]